MEIGTCWGIDLNSCVINSFEKFGDFYAWQIGFINRLSDVCTSQVLLTTTSSAYFVNIVEKLSNWDFNWVYLKKSKKLVNLFTVSCPIKQDISLTKTQKRNILHKIYFQRIKSISNLQ